MISQRQVTLMSWFAGLMNIFVGCYVGFNGSIGWTGWANIVVGIGVIVTLYWIRSYRRKNDRR
ncbi:hypothetical protein [Candidatus Solirubrobacter pratensis]|uniref:hypothetical protein n=1 Tax=Candidatus Solirubrobacter pratensis TaxID=1298857 RepID=UPI00041C1F52|nr:hypothetical protein [Candidatus Solirubrobacter pratensis]